MKTSSHVKLNAQTVKSLKCPQGAVQWDFYDDTSSSPAGFGLRVGASDSRAFFLFWRCRQTGRKGRLTLTVRPHANDGLARARDEAHDQLAEIRKGNDPVKQREAGEQAEQRAALEASRALTFTQLAERYVAEAEISARTAREYRRSLAYDLKETIGNIDVRKLQWIDVEPVLARIRKRAPIMSNRVFAHVRAILAWGVDKGLLSTNVMVGHKRLTKSEPSRERVLDDAELAAVWRSLDSKPALMAAAVRLLVLLGSRISELLSMQWADLDLAGQPPTWSVPGPTRKGGKALRLPLPPLAVKILESLPQRGARVFEGLGLEPAHWFDPWRDALVKAGAVKESFHRHDLRRTCATGCGDLGTSPHVVERILGHKSAGIVKVYQRSERLPEVASALNAWAAHVEQLVSGQKRRADVVPMHA
jgi:integrase